MISHLHQNIGTMLTPIKKKNIKEAAKFINVNGVPSRRRKSEFWVIVEKTEYQFKYLTAKAFKIATDVELDPDKFQSSTSTRRFIKNLGFKVVYRIPQSLQFFTTQEIKRLKNLQGKKYKKSKVKGKKSVDEKIGDSLKKGLYKKTNAWAQALNLDGWEVKKDNNWQISGYYKKYTWARIYKEGDEDKRVFFTVGVDSNTLSLIYKIDCQHSGGEKLSSKQVSQFRVLESKFGSKWVNISLKDLTKYDWKKLISDTRKYITKYEGLYDSAVKELWSEKTIESRISRVCWNTNGWVRPSGKAGKSRDQKTHEGEYGYGHEEWLFDLDKIIDGYHYGFLEPIRKSQSKHQHSVYNVILYSIDGESKQKCVIGGINNLEVLTTEASEKVREIYVKNGWLGEMEEQINNVVHEETGFSEYAGIDILNVRFKPTDAHIYIDYIDLEDTDFVIKSFRYKFLNDIRKTKRQEGFREKPFKFTPGKKGKRGKLGKRVYYREPKRIELKSTHKNISVELEKYLTKTSQVKNVVPEHYTGKGTHIDMVLKKGKKIIFYEIKTYNNLRMCIREATGQLLEYSYWPTEDNAHELIIVSHHKADAQTKRYMENLRMKFSLPLYYQCFDLDTNALMDKV